MDFLQNYLDFHRKFKFPEPDNITTKHAEMRLNFLLEELMETATAAGYELAITNDKGADVVKFVRNKHLKINKGDYIDGIADLLYVVLGTAVTSGLSKKTKCNIFEVKIDEYGKKFYERLSKFEHAFINIHSANMKKILVKSKKQSKRNTKFDLIKPNGWEAPNHKELLK